MQNTTKVNRVIIWIISALWIYSIISMFFSVFNRIFDYYYLTITFDAYSIIGFACTFSALAGAILFMLRKKTGWMILIIYVLVLIANQIAFNIERFSDLYNQLYYMKEFEGYDALLWKTHRTAILYALFILFQCAAVWLFIRRKSLRETYSIDSRSIIISFCSAVLIFALYFIYSKNIPANPKKTKKIIQTETDRQKPSTRDDNPSKETTINQDSLLIQQTWATFNSFPPITDEELAEIAPVIKKWTDYYGLDLSKARLVKLDTTCFNCEPDTTSLYFRPFEKEQNTNNRTDVDYSPDKQRYISLGLLLDEPDGTPIHIGWDDCQEIFLIDRRLKHQNLVMWNGVGEFCEAAFWKSNDVFILVGHEYYHQPNFMYFVDIFDIANQSKKRYEILLENINEDLNYMDSVYLKDKGILTWYDMNP